MGCNFSLRAQRFFFLLFLGGGGGFIIWVKLWLKHTFHIQCGPKVREHASSTECCERFEILLTQTTNPPPAHILQSVRINGKKKNQKSLKTTFFGGGGGGGWEGSIHVRKHQKWLVIATISALSLRRMELINSCEKEKNGSKEST